MPFSRRHRIDPGQTVKLGTIDPDGRDLGDDREQFREDFPAVQEQLDELQRRLYAERRQKLLVVFQAPDTGGKDGTIRSVFSGLNPQGVRVTSYGRPTEEELAHDYLWRIHRNVPAAGMIHVFNRSHYEDVLAVRVHHLVPEAVWQARYEQINQFEALLADTGTTIIKFFLLISKKEQRKRLQERLDEPHKHWKFDVGDLEKRKLWKEYESAFDDMLSRCSTAIAPWFVIPADQNWYRNSAVAHILLETLQNMNPQYPPAPDLRGIVIED